MQRSYQGERGRKRRRWPRRRWQRDSIGRQLRGQGRAAEGALGGWEGLASMDAGEELGRDGVEWLPGRRIDGLWSSVDGSHSLMPNERMAYGVLPRYFKIRSGCPFPRLAGLFGSAGTFDLFQSLPIKNLKFDHDDIFSTYISIIKLMCSK